MQDLTALAGRIQALMSKWAGGSTSGDIGAQVAFLERFLPATFRDVAPEYARAVEAGEKYPKLVAARCELAAAATAIAAAQDAHAKLIARVAELEGRIAADSPGDTHLLVQADAWSGLIEI